MIVADEGTIVIFGGSLGRGEIDGDLLRQLRRSNQPDATVAPAWGLEGFAHYSSVSRTLHACALWQRDEVQAIVACGGLWDKGRDVREVWEHKETGDRRVLEPTALLDWGHAPGREDAMSVRVAARLMREQGGDLWIEPRPGGGTSFGICLPAITAATEDEGAVDV